MMNQHSSISIIYDTMRSKIRALFHRIHRFGHTTYAAVNHFAQQHQKTIAKVTVYLAISCFITALLLIYIAFLHVNENQRIKALRNKVQAHIEQQHTLSAQWQALTLGKTLWQERIARDLRIPAQEDIGILFHRHTDVAHKN